MWRGAAALLCQCTLVAVAQGHRAYRARGPGDSVRCGDEQAAAQPTAVLSVAEQVDHELKCIALCNADADCKGISYDAAGQRCTLHAAYTYAAGGGRTCRKLRLGEQEWRRACDNYSTTPDSQAVYYKGKCLVHCGNGEVDTLQKALDTCAAIANATRLTAQLVYVKSARMNAARANMTASELGGHTRVRRDKITGNATHTNGPWVLMNADGSVDRAVVPPPGAWAHVWNHEPDKVYQHYTLWTEHGVHDAGEVSLMPAATAAKFGHAVCEIDNPYNLPKWAIKAMGERIIDEHVLEEIATAEGAAECGRRCLLQPDCASIAYAPSAHSCLLQRFEYDEPANEHLDPIVNVGTVPAAGYVWYENE